MTIVSIVTGKSAGNYAIVKGAFLVIVVHVDQDTVVRANVQFAFWSITTIYGPNSHISATLEDLIVNPTTYFKVPVRMIVGRPNTYQRA